MLGPVFRAHQAGRDRLVAVKVFKLDLTSDQVVALQGELQRLVRSKLEHPSIVKALAAGTEAGVAYLAQEYVPADPVEVVVRQMGPLPIEDVLRIMTELAGAIDMAAAAGFSHGQLHLRDILVTRGDARLTGLGIARALEQAGFTDAALRPHAAPERARPGEWGRPADIYSLAHIAYELLFGRRLDSPPEEAVKALRETAGVGSSLVEVLSTALSASPGARHETAVGFARELNRAATHSPRQALPSGRRAPVAEEDESGADADALRPTLARRDPVEGTLAMAAPEPLVELGDTLFDLYGEGEVAAPAFDEPSSDSPPAAGLEGAAEPAEPRTARAPRADADQVPLWSHDTRALPPRRGAGIGWTAWGAAALVLLMVATGLFFALRGGPGALEPSGSGGRDWTEARVNGASTASPSTPRGAVPATGAAAATATVPSAEGRASQKANGPPRAPAGDARRAPASARAVSASAPGRLLVRSSPEGAVVTVNGERRGATPLVLRDLALGEYEVRVAHPGYAPVERRVTLTAAEPSGSMVLTLTDAAPVSAGTAAGERPALGSIAALSRPSGAMVYLDGRAIGRTPIVVAQIAPGSHAIRIELEGHRRWATTIEVTGGARTRVAASLERGGPQ
jgi:hypothetical protein